PPRCSAASTTRRAANLAMRLRGTTTASTRIHSTSSAVRERPSRARAYGRGSPAGRHSRTRHRSGHIRRSSARSATTSCSAASARAPPNCSWRAEMRTVERYFEDYVIGERRETTGRTITEADIVTHAGQTGDFFPHHMDKEWAATQPFEKRIAHGTLIMSVAVGQTAGDINPQSMSYGYDRVRF